MTADRGKTITDSINPIDSAAKGSSEDLELERRLSRLWQFDMPFAGSSSSPVKLLNGYKIRRVLGGGAFGIVYLADDLENDRCVAIKVPRPEVLLNADNRERFANEAVLAAKLKHPGIVEVYQTQLAGPTPYIAAAYCEGPDLAKWLAERSEPLPWREGVELLIRICDAVQYAHQQGVHHRDLKPANIMMTVEESTASAKQIKNLQPKITDFGLAKLADPMLTTTRSSLIIGTPMYMAPEQMEPGSYPDAVTIDVYALGVILFELLTGQFPVQGNSYFEVLDNIRALPATRLRSIRKDLPKQLERVCSTCLQANPQARYASVAALSGDLRRCLEGQSVEGNRTSILSPFNYWCTRPARVAGAGWFLIGNGMIVGVWVFMVVAFSLFYGVVTWGEYLRQWQDALFIAIVNVMPSSWVGWKMVRGKLKNHWPIWVGIAASAWNIPPLALAIVWQPLIFQAIYDDLDPFFAFTVHIVLLMCSLVQLMLLACALAASRAKNKCSKVE